MKLYYIQNSRLPTEKAHGYQIVKMCEAFSKLNNDLILVLPKRKNPIQKTLFDYYKIERNFTVEYIDGYDFFSINLIPQKISYYLNEFYFLLLLAFKQTDNRSVCITRNPLVAFCLKIKKKFVIYECHDWFNKHKKIALSLLKKVNLIITTNRYIRNNFLDNAFDPKAVHCIPNGIDLKIFDNNLSNHDARKILAGTYDNIFEKIIDKKIILYTGSYKTMGVEKGIDEVLKALVKIKTKDVVFLAVGGNIKDIDYYNQIAKQLGVDEKVILLGRVEQKTLAIMQKAANLLLMPFPNKAHYKYHMTPLKMFEYMASKRPIIASTLPSIKEILNEHNSFLVEPDSINELSKMIDYVLNNATQATLRSDNAFNDVFKYQWTNRAAKIIDLIKYGN